MNILLTCSFSAVGCGTVGNHFDSESQDSQFNHFPYVSSADERNKFLVRINEIKKQDIYIKILFRNILQEFWIE